MCRITSYAVPVTDSSGRIYVGGAYTSQSKCEEHGWMFMPGEMNWEGKICPIGRIEDATEKAIAAIQAEKAKPWP